MLSVLMVLVLRVLGVLWLLGALPAEPLAAQPRDTRGAVKGTGVIAGVVVSDEAEPKPIRRARVMCATTDAPGVTTITDDAGRFACGGLATGKFHVTASRDAWVTTTYGAKRPLRPGTPVPVTSGEQTDIVLRLARGAVITGTILDQNGQPASGAGVRAMRYAIQNGERRLAAHGTAAITDDRGVYRIYGLAAGDYIVGATARAGFGGRESSELRLMPEADVRQPPAGQQAVERPDPRERSVTIASIYYPGSPVSSQASLITVRAGEERGGVDFALQLATTARVDGTVSLPEGGTPPGLSVTLMANMQTTFPGQPFDGFRTGRAGSDGSFSFSDISPGQYTLLARGVRPPPEGAAPGTPAQMVWASADLTIDGEHVSALALVLEPGLAIAGQVRFESATQKPVPDLKALRVSLQPVQTQGTASISPNAAAPEASGQFRLSGATPGRYRLSASGPGTGRPGGWVLRSAVINGQDTLDTPFVLQPNQSVTDAVITFTDRLAQLTGMVQNAAGAPSTEFTIVVFPAEQTLWAAQSRRIHGVRAAADGTYLVRNLPAGNYLLAAVDDVEPGEWFDPAFLQRLAPAAMRLAIADGEQKVQDVRIGGG